MNTATFTRPDDCPMCGECDDSWPTTEHGVCDTCMNLLNACLAQSHDRWERLEYSLEIQCHLNFYKGATR